MSIEEVIQHTENNKAYSATQITTKRTTLSWAQSINGIMGNNGPLSISSLTSMEMTFGLRSIHQGILVGINTVLLDNPKLTCRSKLNFIKNPVPIIMDSNLRTPIDCYLIIKSNPIIFYRNETNNKSVLESKGAKCFKYSTMEDVYTILYQLNIYSIMVEGGPTILKSFLPFATSCVVTIGKKCIAEGIIAKFDLDMSDATLYNWEKDIILVKHF